MSTVVRTPVSRARTIAGWILSIVPSLPFLVAAVMKFTTNPQEAGMFVLFGFPLWFMYLVGVCEVVGVALLLFSRRPLYGAVLLAAVGLSATFEHLTHGQLAMAPIPFLCACFAVSGALLRGNR